LLPVDTTGTTLPKIRKLSRKHREMQQLIEHWILGFAGQDSITQ